MHVVYTVGINNAGPFMMRPLLKRILTVLYLSAAISLPAFAQLKADFTIDKAGGCSPLTVQFTNTTTGASAGVKYKWDFGNGNGSGLESPGATYTQEKTFTVTLTATDGGNTSIKTQQVTVYKKPAADFSLTPSNGCLPLDVKFTSKTTPGDGTISGYFWDFGDGQTKSGSTYNDITHTYTFAQKPVISLTVTNSNGCYTTVSKSNQLNLAGAVTSSFTSDKTVLCKPGDQVVFTNKSTGDGTLTYKWDFGDGQKSTDKSPTHTYADKGTYTVKLTTSSSAGCTADTIKTGYINVASFGVGFTLPVPLCTSSEALFTDTSTKGFDNIEWKLDGQQVYPSQSTDNSFIFNFYDTINHTVVLTHNYGGCIISKSKTFKASASPQTPNFTQNIKGACEIPVTVNFSDSTKGAVKWEWFDSYPYMVVPFATGQQATKTFPAASLYDIGLRVTNGAGCSSYTWQTVNLQQPVINIYVKNTEGRFSHTGCIGATFVFSIDQPDVIKSYHWDFGDGGSSTAVNPSHKFPNPGPYPIVLNYVTKNGCTGKSTFNYVGIIDNRNVNVDFKVMPDSAVCGNTLLTFAATPFSGWTYYWSFGDGTYDYNGIPGAQHQYYYDSMYTVQLIVSNEDCRDTVTKPQYIKIKPDFPKIGTVINTCEGTRGDVTFTDASAKVTKWIWDFGDGTPNATYNSPQDVHHTYKKSGRYTAVLTGINNGCSVGDSVAVYVLIKQTPKLSSSKTVTCGSDALDFTVSGMDDNPSPYFGNAYAIPYLQYSDLKTAYNNYYWFDHAPYSNYATALSTGEENLRAIIQSSYFNCYDTTNFIPIKIRGPQAAYAFKTNDICFKKPVVIKDSSKPGPNLPIAKWEWNLGDGTIVTNTTNSSITHTYPNPGFYNVELTVTDTAGCTNSTNGAGGNAIVSGPKADFSVSADPVAPNTVVYFYNNTNTYGAFDINYTWVLPNGSRPHDYSSQFLFKDKGSDTVKLIASNNQQHCIDTAIKIIHVKQINTAFNYTLSYINNNNCPPVIVNFTSNTINALRINWDFGDGSHADNQRNVSHTYTNAGVYRVVLYGYDISNNLDSTEDFIEVKGPYATLNADKLTGCDSITVTLSAAIKNASSFTWDFGDGTLTRTTDTFSIHTYDIPGVYTPQLILKDGEGCSGTSALQTSIIIDNIDAIITKSPAVICDSAIVYFQPDVASVAKDVLQMPLQYHWDFGTGNAADTSNLQAPAHRYAGVGSYNASLVVTSPYGCTETVTSIVNVQTVSRAGITGPTDICENTAAIFNGTATNFNNNLSWHWMYGDQGKELDGPAYQNPPAYTYSDTGLYAVELIVNNNGCYDSANLALYVHGYPRAAISPQNPVICLGGSMQLTAHNGITYSWQPGSNIDDTKSSSPTVSPKSSMYYYVTTTNAYNCAGYDSVMIKVQQPFKVTANPQLYICIGSTGQLQASGADKYVWITGAGLSSNSIANPIVTTNANGVYTVVGYDSVGCFTDTASTAVSIKTLPAVVASPHAVTINAGTDIQLSTQPSADVVKYSWLPPDYLSCADCGAPLSSPRLPVTYIVKVFNEYGCTASDTVQIKLVCAENLVYIPNAFTPNGDNRNDRFVLSGNSIKMVRHIVIYSRLGNKLFERNYIPTNDFANSWDGTAGGLLQPGGAYVYFAEIECATGEIFKYKGTITLIR